MDRRAIAISGIVQGVGFRPHVYGLATRLRLGGLHQERQRRRPDRGRGRLAFPRPVPRRADRSASATGPDRRAPVVEPAGARRSVIPDRAQRARRGQPDLHLARRRHLRRLPGRAVRSPRSPLPLSLPQLHQLRPPADDHHRRRPTTASGRPWPRSPCAPTAGRSTTTPPTAASTPSRPPAPPAARDCGCWMNRARRSPASIRSPAAVDALRRGRIGAIKGLGGYHLACDAGHADAVAELRSRKHRDEKPFALMVQDLAAARALCELSPAEERCCSRLAGRSSCCAVGRGRRSPTRSRRAIRGSA